MIRYFNIVEKIYVFSTETGELNCEEIMEILNVHNEIRQSIAKGLIKNQPRASNMREMVDLF